MPTIIWLDEPAATDPRWVGPKAAGLARLLQHGLPVPRGFCVSVEATARHFNSSNLLGLVGDLESSLVQGDSWRRPAALLRGAIASIPLEPGLSADLASAYARLRSSDGGLVAARSSALVEDAPSAGFAGQLTTLLGLANFDDLVVALRACWAARWSERVLEYALGRGVGIHSSDLAVIVQAMVPATAAGGALSVDLVSGRSDVMLITGAWGLGRAVAEGEVVPDQWTLRRDDLGSIERRAGHKPLAARVGPDGGEQWERLPREKWAQLCLDDDQVAQLGRLLMVAEALFGAPRELEWAYADGCFWLLQARPLVLPEPPHVSVATADIDWYAAWVARRLAWQLSPAPTPWALATSWPGLLSDLLRPLTTLGAGIPRPEDVFAIDDGLAVRFAPRWPARLLDESSALILSSDSGDRVRRQAQCVRDRPDARRPSVSGWDLPPDALDFLTPADLASARPGLDGRAALSETAKRRRLRYRQLDERNVLLPLELLGPWLCQGPSLAGLPTSPGLAVGRARVARRPEDLAGLRPGEILVVTIIRPSMTTRLPAIAGLIAESGGSTSHAANLARERRIPAVLGARGGTTAIRDGDLVFLDGAAGLAWRRSPARRPEPR